MDGQSWQWDGVNFEILHPDAGSYAITQIRDNNRGCVLRISIGNRHILLTADIEKDSEQQLLTGHADSGSMLLTIANSSCQNNAASDPSNRIARLRENHRRETQ